MTILKAPELVAVYGTLRRDNGNYMYHLSSEEYLGTFRTPKDYTMYTNGGFPMVTLNGDKSIICEVFKVTSNIALQGLDNLEGYPNFYNRKQIETPFGKAWMYFIENLGRDYPEIESGDWNLENNIGVTDQITEFKEEEKYEI